MSIRSIYNGMYPKRIPRLEKAIKNSESRYKKPAPTYSQIRAKMRRKLGWD